MSLKNVELQVALPRTLDNSRLQQQLQHQNSLQNAQTSEELAARNQKAEQTVLHGEESARAALGEREGKGRQQKQSNGRQASEENAGEAESPHPYKGQRLDIKL